MVRCERIVIVLRGSELERKGKKFQKILVFFQYCIDGMHILHRIRSIGGQMEG